ncbi:MAG: competence protein ComEA [Zetaproteobacteria bacterium CG12_big_fil_rev_8_21_14_0_65_55_1124]|nr:MAG: competence protein ComEA [Zetaproteobacteria bacterium CG1_02_55_237]PIS18487.1 MAG: competence protein ComEA [Zetaproteobacteria bacterium CG08_land_8_20_14_0_20_55_17]PIW43021.1 MAG: competence protein ComEA [Zetaproteobacteria bacterium CG12_big_fil_rev_8_21_14_0_65_55_1124]PIY52613.1 MAG: competence protein ComEA [Zetaproteobacteria bacterium CG_4_10_14_0_8_um_filter_55_43]PIZ36827.1 MAG: competence protein ComEA [Zetaproteobacteria bacterium CG_4_10_14_0_2_um_filter_55_20]PJB79318
MKKIVLSMLVAIFMAIGTAWAGDAVNINTATAKELQKVHGIGAKIADMIVTYRDEHGAFKSVEELKHVKGIGKKTLEKIKDDLTTGEAKE